VKKSQKRTRHRFATLVRGIEIPSPRDATHGACPYREGMPRVDRAPNLTVQPILRAAAHVVSHPRNQPIAASRSTNVRHAFYIVAGAVALVLTWPHAFSWMAAGGNIFNPVAFFGDALAAGGTAAFLTIDMAIAWLVFMVWVVTDSKRIGLGYKWGWIFVALSYIGVSMAFPVYLVTRERYLDKRARTPELTARPNL